MVIQRPQVRSRTAQSLASPKEKEKEKESDAFEQTLRPRNLRDYIGQEKNKEHLRVYMAAAKQRKEPLGHTLLHGPPGLGKTTLAHIIAAETEAQIRLTTGPAIEKPGDLASILTNLQRGDVLFIDEIHRLRPVIEEVLYSAMEEYALDIVIGKGPSARSVRIDLKPFTLVGATTKVGSISAPLRHRFVHTFKLHFYTLDEMTAIVERSARILNIMIDASAAQRIAASSRATPRIANRILRAVRDFAQITGERHIDSRRVEESLQSLGIDHRGLDPTDRLLLETIIEKFAGGPVGLSTLAAATAEEEQTIEEVHEPYLLQIGFLKRTPQGRVVTPLAYDHLGLSAPRLLQEAML
jgi:Holliday junction DNA helicase RuvB